MDYDHQTGGGFDNDITVQITPNPDGSTTLLMTYRDSDSAEYDLQDSNGNTVMPNFNPGMSWTSQPGATTQAEANSYGVNSQAKKFGVTDDSQKILVLEYWSQVADWVGANATGVFSDFAPRHNGVLNVLFRDGSVRDMALSDVDPRLTSQQYWYWTPTVMTQNGVAPPTPPGFAGGT